MMKINLQLFAHKKGVGSSRNGRDSESKRLGPKRAYGQFVLAGNIPVSYTHLAADITTPHTPAPILPSANSGKEHTRNNPATANNTTRFFIMSIPP